MFRRLSKCWRYIKYFFDSKKAWYWPRQSDVLIFDACGQDILLKYVRPWNPEALHVRNEFINVPVLLASIFRDGKKTDAYIDCFIEKVRPKLVITFIDNNPIFFAISKRHPTLKTMFIQNGIRAHILEGKKPEDTHGKVDYMMVFGGDIGSEYSKYIQGVSVSIGSLKNNHYPKSYRKVPGTIAFISQYNDFESILVGGKLFTHQQFFQADKIVLDNLVRYANKNRRKFLIILAHGSENSLCIKEKEFYSNLLGPSVSYYDPRECFNSYYNADVAEVVVGVFSTLLYESIARGNKTAIFPLRGQLLDAKDHSYGWPGEYLDDGPFWTNHPNSENFERIMDHLFEIDDKQWHAELAEHSFDKVMTYDPGNGILKSILTKELGAIASS